MSLMHWSQKGQRFWTPAQRTLYQIPTWKHKEKTQPVPSMYWMQMIERNRLPKQIRNLLSSQNLQNQKETITVREGPRKTDTPDTGEGTYRLLSDGKQVGNVLAHFNLAGKVVRVTKPTESRPTLQIRLKETLSQLKSDGLLSTEPLKIQRGSKGNPELWAHLP